MATIGKHAVVIGASMGGLLAARALSEYYEQVTVFERDAFPPPGEPRKGVPQGKHIHVLLSGGRDVLEGFFPGLTQSLLEQGALTGDQGEIVRWYDTYGFFPRYQSGMNALLVTRPRLESAVRERVRALPNVRILESSDVRGLVVSPDRRRITGVRLVRHTEGNPAEETLDADLVLDAGGRGSRSPAWLEALGYARPTEDQLRIDLAYTTRLYRRDPVPQDWLATAILPVEGIQRGGVIMAIEGDRWIAALSGYFGEQAPTDEAGFLEYTRSLARDDIYQVLKTAQPLGEAAVYQYRNHLRRRYERLKRFPGGYLVFADAICSFNPVYGQGMTVAAFEGQALAECLAQGEDHLAERFFKKAARLIDSPWSIAIGADLRNPGVTGPRSLLSRLTGAYIDRLGLAAHEDTRLSLAFQRVTNLLDPPAALLRPAVVLRVILGNLRMARRKPVRKAEQALNSG